MTTYPALRAAKSLDAVEAVVGPGKLPITVSKLRDTEQFLDGCYRDILYAVGFAPDKQARAKRFIARGAQLTVPTATR